MIIGGKIFAEYNEFENMIVDLVDTFPSAGSVGQLVLNTSDNKLYIYDGSSWTILLSTSGGASSFLQLNGGNHPIANISWDGHRITGLGDPIGNSDAANKQYVDVAVDSVGSGSLLRLDGTNSPIADISWGGLKIVDLGDPIDNTDAANKAYVDNRVTAWNNDYIRVDGTVSPITNISWGNNKIINLTDPTDSQDIATKNYVDLNVPTLSSLYLALDGSNSPLTDIDMNNHRITDLADPVNPDDIVTKSYADNSGTAIIDSVALYSQTIDASVNIGDTVKYNHITGTWEKAQLPKEAIGLFVGSGEVLLLGYTNNLSGLTSGVTYYLDSSGQLTTNPGDKYIRAGYALSTTEFLLDLDVH